MADHIFSKPDSTCLVCGVHAGNAHRVACKAARKPKSRTEYDMLWDQGRRRKRINGKLRSFDAGEIPVKVLHRGPRATDDAGPGSGGGSKVRILLEDGKVTSVYARNLKPRARHGN
jgi:hypothetical protein